MSQGADPLVGIKGRGNFLGSNQRIDQGEQHILWLPAHRVKGDQSRARLASGLGGLIGLGVQMRGVDRTDQDIPVRGTGRHLAAGDVRMCVALQPVGGNRHIGRGRGARPVHAATAGHHLGVQCGMQQSRLVGLDADRTGCT